MGWQADDQDETGSTPGRPGDRRAPRRDPLLAGFMHGGLWDQAPPSYDLAIALSEASGPGWSCPGAAHDELTGLLRGWQALESWAAAGKLGVLRALIREDQFPGEQVPPGHLPPLDKPLVHEVALALAMSPVTAANLMYTAHDLEARLPGIGARLADGKLTLPKARLVNDTLRLLSEADVIMAEELVLDRLAGQPSMTYGQLEKTATWAALEMDPEFAARRRKSAEQEDARVRMFREDSGAAALSGRDLPTDETLIAHSRICDRAQQYKDSGAFPGARMDRLRAIAYLDLLNGITADQRIDRKSVV